MRVRASRVSLRFWAAMAAAPAAFASAASCGGAGTPELEKIERALRAVPCANGASAQWAHANVIAPCTEALLS